MGHNIKTYLHLGQYRKYVDIKLQSVEGEFDDQLQWPLHCTLSIQLLDQRGEHHLQRSVELQIKRGSNSNAFGIKYDDIRNPTNGAKYLKEDCLHFRIDVKPKHK